MSVQGMRAWLVVAACSALTGCTRNTYDLELKPEGQEIRRELTIRGAEHRAGTPHNLSEAEQRALVDAYGEQAEFDRAGPLRLAGSFASRMPDDVGGAGANFHWTTSLGSLSGYVERFRGASDPALVLEERQRTADELVDLARDWAVAQAGDAPERDALRQFVDTELRRDLRTLVHLAHHAAMLDTSPEQTQASVGAKMSMFLWERGYLKIDDWPRWRRRLQSNRADEVLAVICAALDQRGQLSRPLREIVPVLASANAFEQSFVAFVAQSDFFRRRAAARRDAEPADPRDVVGDALLFTLLGTTFGHHDTLRSRMQTPRAPFLTNGAWVEEEGRPGRLAWEDQLPLPGDEHGLSALHYAVWTEPDVAAQTARFGRVLLVDAELAEYVQWRLGLSEAEAVEWERLLESLTPGPELRGRVEALRFENDPNGDLADIPRQLFAQALDR